MHKLILLSSCLAGLFSFISCSENTKKQNSHFDFSAFEQHDSSYMRTGFYFLTIDTINGIQMKEYGSNKLYSLCKIPFASVDNIKNTQLKTTKLQQSDYTELCMAFDSKGTKDLQEGTGNSEHPRIAVVILGKLLYVVDNNTKIKTGVMCVGLLDYFDEDMKAIKLAVDQKN